MLKISTHLLLFMITTGQVAILKCMLDSQLITSLTVFVILLLVSVSLHEMMHALVAYRLGDDLAHSHGRISLNPLRHIDPVLTIALPAIMVLFSQPPILAAKPVPINRNRISGDELGLAAVGIAGPLTNLLLATIGALVLNALSPTGLLQDILELFVRLNVSLFAFNMLPIPPLDGSRLLYAVAPPGIQRFMEQIEQMGIFFNLMILYVLIQFLSPILTTVNTFFLDILLR